MALPVKIWPKPDLKKIPASKARPPLQRTVTQNISTAGCYFSLPQGLPIGSQIEMEIQIPAVEASPSGITLRCHATVVRVEKGPKPGVMGVACQIQQYWYAKSGARPQKANAA